MIFFAYHDLRLWFLERAERQPRSLESGKKLSLYTSISHHDFLGSKSMRLLRYAMHGGWEIDPLMLRQKLAGRLTGATNDNDTPKQPITSINHGTTIWVTQKPSTENVQNLEDMMISNDRA